MKNIINNAVINIKIEIKVNEYLREFIFKNRTDSYITLDRILGSEFNISAKFTPDRRCSPVVGITANLDFYSNRTCGFYETRTNYYYSSFYIDRVFVEYPIVKYFDFYIQPYIAFCVNLY